MSGKKDDSKNRVLNRSNREAVPAIVVVRRINFRTIEVQVPRIRGRVVRGRPVVPVRAPIVQSRTIVVAAGREDTHSAVATYYDIEVECSDVASRQESYLFQTDYASLTCDL